MQLDKSRALEVHCMCIGKSHTNVQRQQRARGSFSLAKSVSVCFALERVREENRAFLSVTNFLFYSFSILSFSHLFFPSLGVLEKFSINTLTAFPITLFFRRFRLPPIAREKPYFSLSYPRSSSCITNIYRMRGLTDFARTIPIGKKIIGNFRLVDAFFPSASTASLSQSSFGFLCVWTSHLAFDFCRFSVSPIAQQQ